MATTITTPSGIWSTMVIAGQRHRRLLAECKFYGGTPFAKAAEW